MRAAFCVVFSARLASALVGQTCYYPTPPTVHESWSLQPTGLLQLLYASPPLCAALAAWPPAEDGVDVLLQPCNVSSPAQLFALLPNASLVLSRAPRFCLNLKAYGTAPGTDAWVTPCDAAACRGNCAWAAVGATLVNSGLCLQDGSALPPLPHTCAPASPAAGLPFCDATLPVGARVDDLLARLTPAEKVALFNMGTGGFSYIPRLNVKAWHHDFTCIRGVNFPNGVANAPPVNVSVFPHAIAQAASFDLPLVAAVSNATAYEARALNQVLYASSGGTLWAGTSCDGGPLANTAHDPRWGRISECYGEDVALSSAVGVVATRVMQNRSADARWLRTSQVTRHWLGFHMASPDLPHGGEEEISLHAFADLQAPVYRAFQVDGEAEGLMCGYAAFSIGGGALVPSCVHPFLWEKLRDEWSWPGFVQTDCCDSITSAVEDHHFFPNISAAVLSAIELGVSTYFGFNSQLVGAVGDLLASNVLDAALFDERLRPPLLMRFRTGEFDAGSNPEYPYAAPLDAGALDGAEHRALARAAVAASAVLLRNEGGALPLALPAGATLAVVGPFADCQSRGVGDRDVDSPLQCSYEHTYGGMSGAVSTILGAAREEGAARGWGGVLYAQGSNIRTEVANGTAAAAAAAAAADATVLVLGLGMLLEVEGVDRATLRLPAAQEALLAAVAGAARGPLILCIVSAGMVDANFSAAAAAVQVFYPGAETGHGVWDVLAGRTAPSARLPVTAYKEAYLAAMHDSIANFSLVSSTGVGKTYRYADDSSALWQGSGGSGPFQSTNAPLLPSLSHPPTPLLQALS
jgi:beta-glucosidase-like glycosyl hydrolase